MNKSTYIDCICPYCGSHYQVTSLEFYDGSEYVCASCKKKYILKTHGLINKPMNDLKDKWFHKVYQSTTERGKGDCMPACAASLLGLELTDVPHFNLMYSGYGNDSMCNFFRTQNCDEKICLSSPKLHDDDIDATMKELYEHGGIEGMFMASVKSLTNIGAYHMIIINTDMKVVHDPNPNQLAMKCKLEDIRSFWLIKKGSI